MSAKRFWGWQDLKHVIRTEPKVECPVLGCTTEVERRQRKHGLRQYQYFCQQHGIYISPTTFEYKDEADNLLWHHPDDLSRLAEIKRVKAEVRRLGRERSEDAVTWNVFRLLENQNHLSGVCESMICPRGWDHVRLIYWSYDPVQRSAWDMLLKARVEFGEADTLELAQGKRVSEPDLIVVGDGALAFVENKFGSDNDTSGKGESLLRRLNNPKAYCTGGGQWYDKVFTHDYRSVVSDHKYELLRFWLLGSWIAQQHEPRLRFYLVNVVREGEETDIETKFGDHIRQDDQKRFVRLTWEDIQGYVVANATQDEEKDTLLTYFSDKTMGYPGGKLVRAFSVGQ